MFIQQASAPALRAILDASVATALLRELGFREEIADFIGDTSREVAQGAEAQAFLDFFHTWQIAPVQQLKDAPSQWQALAAVCAIPAALEGHRQRGVPFEVSKATFLDLQRRMQEYFEQERVWGFDKLAWFRNHASTEFFELGRLQYRLGTFDYLARVYRDTVTDGVITLASSGRRCTLDGWPRDDATGFETSLVESVDGICGHLVSPEDGTISATPIRIAPSSTELLNSGCAIAHVHIPSGDKLDPQTCRDSLRTAKAFFGEYFPEIKLRGFCTSTWLLDRELARVLPAHSNIVAFGKLFRPLALLNGDDKQLLERVFGREATWDICETETSLQKAVWSHHQSGGQFRTTAGFILADDIEDPSNTL